MQRKDEEKVQSELGRTFVSGDSSVISCFLQERGPYTVV